MELRNNTTINNIRCDDSTFKDINVFNISKELRCMCLIRVITKLPDSEQSYKGKVKTHNYINRQNQSTTGKL